MKSISALDALAEHYGIESEFVDARGDLVATSPDTKRALLAALGVSASADVEAQHALSAVEKAAWEHALPPVVVAKPHDIRFELVLPQGSAEARWRLTLESGDTRSGTFALDGLPRLAATEQDGVALERRECRLPADIPFGYHRLTIESGSVDDPAGPASRAVSVSGKPTAPHAAEVAGPKNGLAQAKGAAVSGEMTLIVTPGRCWLPSAIESGERLSGIAIQLYLLRSRTNWGIGDYTDLRRFVELVADAGGDVVGLNPLHELFIDNPEHASPYSPASRLLLNVLNIDVEAVPEYAHSEPAQARARESGFTTLLQACRDAALVDYSNVAALKLEMLRLMYGTWGGASLERREAFARYRSTAGATTERSCVFLALRAHFGAGDPARAAWWEWPPEYRDPESPAVAQFVRDHAGDVTFMVWLQWLADEQLAAAAQAASSMRVGLYRDLAVGADPAGAETWINQRAVVTSARVGAPPDIYNPPGQNWDLPPFHPQALRAEAYASFIELCRANMRHAGGLRIDHVMALQHLYWIPQGSAPPDGAYVRYPLDDLVGILALESRRANCFIVGEDLGTVPAGFRERMAQAGVLSYRVLFFERETDAEAAFIEPTAYPTLALAVLGSHDLPTLGAWWNGDDIELRRRIGLIADDDRVKKMREERERDRAALITALARAGIADSKDALEPEAMFEAVHAFLAATSCALAIAQIDDVTDERQPVNVPTTSVENPNWRRRLSRTLEELETDPRFKALFATLSSAGRLRGSNDRASGASGA